MHGSDVITVAGVRWARRRCWRVRRWLGGAGPRRRPEGSGIRRIRSTIYNRWLGNGKRRPDYTRYWEYDCGIGRHRLVEPRDYRGRYRRNADCRRNYSDLVNGARGFGTCHLEHGGGVVTHSDGRLEGRKFEGCLLSQG